MAATGSTTHGTAHYAVFLVDDGPGGSATQATEYGPFSAGANLAVLGETTERSGKKQYKGEKQTDLFHGVESLG